MMQVGGCLGRCADRLAARRSGAFSSRGQRSPQRTAGPSPTFRSLTGVHLILELGNSAGELASAGVGTGQLASALASAVFP